MKITLMPELTEGEQALVADWVQKTLASDQLAQRESTYPYSGKHALYLDGQFKILHVNEYWTEDGNSIYLGYNLARSANHRMPLLDRLAVVGGIISLAGIWDSCYEQYTARAATVLISSYQGVMSGLVRTEAAVNGLAFNADRSVIAARIGECYHAPDGTAVEIDDSWTVVLDRPAVTTQVSLAA